MGHPDTALPPSLVRVRATAERLQALEDDPREGRWEMAKIEHIVATSNWVADGCPMPGDAMAHPTVSELLRVMKNDHCRSGDSWPQDGGPPHRCSAAFGAWLDADSPGAEGVE